MTDPASPPGWCLSIPATRAAATALSGDHPALSALDPLPAIVATEITANTIAAADAAAASDNWRVDVYFEARPDAATVALFEGAVGGAGMLAPLPGEDWLTVSQAGLDPVRAGRFHVRGAAHPPPTDPAAVDLVVEAAQAFGTGHHATTAGCLLALDRLRTSGLAPAAIADIGTGTGLLAFAAHRLWPAARIIASDIDPVAVALAGAFAATNHVPTGRGRGRLELVTAAGMAHRRLAAGAPFDLLIANILAGPLIALAPDFARACAPGGRLLVAGLIADQAGAVTRAYARAGFVALQSGGGAWPTLLFARRCAHGHRRPQRTPTNARQPKGDVGEW